MPRWKISIAVAAAIVLLLFILVPSVALVLFSGLLMAAFLHGGGGVVERVTSVPRGWSIGIFALLLLLAIIGVFTLAATSIAGQFDQLASQIPGAIENLRSRLEEYEWASRALDRANPAGLISGESGRAATSAVTSTFGALGNFVIMLFIGIYVALTPAVYRKGAVQLFAPSLRPRASELLNKSAKTLKNWLAAQLISMTVVGGLTGIGLLLIGMPLAFILGIIAGLLAFIPNIGPVLAIAPALLLAFGEGPSMLLWVAAVYLSVQTLESYVITPLVQQERVDLSPALVIAAQLLFGVLFGLLGLALAMPLVAVGRMLIKELYVHDYLEREPPREMALQLPEGERHE
jgi:predicted PurR-regulated permease PerM